MLQFWLAILTSIAFARVSNYLPTDHPEYENWDRLRGYGCARPALTVLRPVEELTLIDSIVEDTEESSCKAPEWLMQEREVLKRRTKLSEARADILWDPSDRIKLKKLEATVLGSYPLQEGRDLYDRGFVYGDATFKAAAGKNLGVALSVTPGWIGGISDAGTYGRFYLQEGYARLAYQRLELTYGRVGYGFGEAKHGSLLLSSSAKPINGWGLGIRPGAEGEFLPNFTFQTFVSDPGTSVFIDQSRLWGVGFGFLVGDWGEFGFFKIMQYLGVGAPTPKNSDYLSMLFYSADPTVLSEHQEMTALNFSVWVNNFAKVYVQLLFNKLTVPSRWIDYDLSTLFGVWLPHLGACEARLEFVSTGVNAYQDSFWKQGLTYQGTMLGHPLGPDAQGVYLDVGLPDWDGWRPELGLSYEDRGLTSAAANTDELRIGFGAGVVKRFTRSEWALFARYEGVGNYLNQSNVSQSLFGAYLDWRYLF